MTKYVHYTQGGNKLFAKSEQTGTRKKGNPASTRNSLRFRKGIFSLLKAEFFSPVGEHGQCIPEDDFKLYQDLNDIYWYALRF